MHISLKAPLMGMSFLFALAAAPAYGSAEEMLKDEAAVDCYVLPMEEQQSCFSEQEKKYVTMSIVQATTEMSENLAILQEMEQEFGPELLPKEKAKLKRIMLVATFYEKKGQAAAEKSLSDLQALTSCPTYTGCYRYSERVDFYRYRLSYLIDRMEEAILASPDFPEPALIK